MSDPRFEFIPSARNHPRGQLAECRLHFTDGIFAGCKIDNFFIYRSNLGTFQVTMPNKMIGYGETYRSYAYIRPSDDKDTKAVDALRIRIVREYLKWNNEPQGETNIVRTLQEGDRFID